MEDTHIHGHTLDLVITKSNDSILQSCNIRDPGLSDHYTVHCNLLVQKTMFGNKLVNSRNLRTLDLDTLKSRRQCGPVIRGLALRSEIPGSRPALTTR